MQEYSTREQFIAALIIITTLIVIGELARWLTNRRDVDKE